MEDYIPEVGDQVMVDGKNGPFTVVSVENVRAVADLRLTLMPNAPLPNGGNKKLIEKNIPFAHIHLLNATE